MLENIMCVSAQLHPNDYKEIQRLFEPLLNKSIDLDQVLQMLDQVWDEMGCDNRNLEGEKINAFYKHPVWLINGFFIEQHDLSLQHRHAISNWIVQHSIKRVLDFGGGFGTLARMIAKKSNFTKIDIYEPYPSNFAVSQCSVYSTVDFVNNLDNKYDCLVSTDVLEHVPDPLKLFSEMIESVNQNGYLIIANCFYPIIKCHLPSTFHLVYTFDRFAEVMGLKVLGSCEGSHATIYQKVVEAQIDWEKVRRMERFSHKLFLLRESKRINLSLNNNLHTEQGN